MKKAKGTVAHVQNQGGVALAAALEKAGPGAQKKLDELLGSGGGYVSHIIAGRFKPGYDARIKIARHYKIASALWGVDIVEATS